MYYSRLKFSPESWSKIVEFVLVGFALRQNKIVQSTKQCPVKGKDRPNLAKYAEPRYHNTRFSQGSICVGMMGLYPKNY